MPRFASLALSSWFFLAFIAIGIPYSALQTARRTGAGAGPAHLGSRTHVYLNAMASQLLIFGIAWYAALLQGLHFLGPFHLTPFDAVAGAAALALLTILAVASVRVRSEAERRRLWVLGFMPHTLREGVVFTLLTTVAPVAEELAYRGVAFTLFTLLTGSAVAGALLSAAIFALAHVPQGGKSMGVIFVIALVKQELVALTGTLWVAIVVHFLHNMFAAVRLARHAGAA